MILCLLHQLRRPAEVDRLLEKIEGVEVDIATCAVRDTLLAEATFGEIRKSPQTATRLADKAFEQIEIGQWPSVRRAMAAHAIDGLASPVLAPRVLDKLQQWFPRWHSYGLAKAFSAMGEWPDDPRIRPTLWRGLHDEYLGSAQAAAQSIVKRFSGEADIADFLVGWSQRRRPSVRRRPRWKPFGGAGRNIPSCPKFSTALARRPTA